jgi:hypothetical protein
MPTNCLQCAQVLRADAQFCPSCGSTVAAAWQPSVDAGGGPVGGGPTPSAGYEAAGYGQVGSGPTGYHPVNPGGPPAAGPPAGQPPYFGPGQVPPAAGNPEFVQADAAGGGRGLGKLVGVGLAVVGLGAAAFLAFRFVTGGDNVAGGASSPEAVVEEMVEAINAKDPLAAVSLMAPDELDGIDVLIEDTTNNLDELGLNPLDADDGDFVVDLEASQVDVSMEGDNAAIVSFELSGDVEVPEDGAGIFTTLGFTNGGFDSSDLEGALPGGGDEVDMIVVKLDGKWFASPMLTGGHYIVENAGLPSGEYDLVGAAERNAGADTADDAVQALVDVINEPDAEELAAVLGGGEGRTALVFRDAIDELFSDIDTSTYEVSLSTDELDDGRIELSDVEIQSEDEYGGSSSISIDEDCATERYDDGSPIETCLLERFGIEDSNDVDTSLWLDTVTEDGSSRVRIVPTLTDVLGRFVGLFDDRQELLYAVNAAQLDEATTVAPGNDVEIEFDGQLYSVNEFPIEEGEVYNVTVSDDALFDMYVQYDGSSLDYQYSSSFTADTDGMARIVVYSEPDVVGDCAEEYNCRPSGEGSATLRIRQATRQTVSFPTIVSGELGPGDVRIFELDVTESETVLIAVDGASVAWEIPNDFDIYVDFETYALVPGTYEMVVYNTSGDESTAYEIVPTPV